MQTGTVLVAILFAATSFPFLGQNSGSDTQTSNPPTAQSQQPSSPSASASSASTAPSGSMPEMRTVRAELVSTLDTKTAKAGDNVVVQTEDNVKTADGTSIPKGTKLVGHVVGVQPSANGKNSEVALELDHAEIAGGQTLPIQSQIQSIGSSDNAMGSSAANMDRGPMNATQPAGGMDSGAPAGATAGSASAAPQRSPGFAPAPESNRGPTAGTVVARTGQIAIRTTAVPGVLVANNEPGQLDPRMAHASSILLGAKQDVNLKEGTPVVMAVATAGGATTKQ